MVTQTPIKKKRPARNGLPAKANGITPYRTSQNWPLDYQEAYHRGPGIYTLQNASTLLSEEPLELFNGWLVWQAMTDVEERRIAANIQLILDIIARASGFGQAFPDQLECEMLNEDVHKPDVCVISKERLEKQVKPETPGSEHLILKGSPELVVELRSPSNRRTKEKQKRKVYFESGAVVIWDVDNRKHKIWVYEVEDQEKGREYSEKDEISCERLFPGWKRRVGDFFSRDLSAEEIVGQVASEWRAESKAEGREEGLVTGRAQGQIAALRAILLIQAQARFSEELPGNLEERLNRCQLGELMELGTLLASVNTIADWLKVLPD